MKYILGSSSFHVPLDTIRISPEMLVRQDTAPTPIPLETAWRSGSAGNRAEGRLLCLKSSAQSFQCSMEMSLKPARAAVTS